MERARDWWGDWEFAPGEVRRWRLGPTTLWVERRPGEWVIHREAGTEPFSESIGVADPCDLDELSELTLAPLRFADGRSGGQGLRLTPRLADRNVISRPEAPFSVLPQETATVYVGTSVWLSVQSPPSEGSFVEFPLLRPSDTWFGENTREGELCYASRTRCRMRREEVRWNPHRAVTQVTIRNSHSTPLRIDRINIPVTLLSLWTPAPGELVTPAIQYTREGSDESIAALEIEAPPRNTATELAKARRSERRDFLRAFSQLI